MKLNDIIPQTPGLRTYVYDNGWKIEEYDLGKEVRLELITDISGFSIGVFAENKPLSVAAMMSVLRETANYAVSMYEVDFERFTLPDPAE